jgi:ATP-binding cassette, subfamily C (CFTR/MRP), member 1
VALILNAAYFAPIFAPILTFTAYSLIARSRGDANLDTNRIFTSLSLFALLQEPLISFVTSLSSLMGSVGSFVRIQSFLNTDVRVDGRVIQHDNHKSDSPFNSRSSSSGNEEKTPSSKGEPKLMEPVSPRSTLNGNVLVVEAGSFGYGTTKNPILSEINLQVPLGKFTLVLGPVGSGKSTLLRAFLGEVTIMAGSVKTLSPEIAYCDQTPWLMNGTVRESIIAFSPVDERWYQRVLDACALREDLAQLPRGDLTAIGSKGIVLSGGQSQRVSLARAVYAQKDVIILDDVFSGLDVHTENTVFHNLLGTHGILRQFKATVIMASSRGTYDS